MKTAKCKRSSRGDTLVEALVGVLVVSLVMATFASMVMTATKMNNSVNHDDGELYQAITDVEKITSGGSADPDSTATTFPGKVLIRVSESDVGTEVDVNYAKAANSTVESKSLVRYSLN